MQIVLSAIALTALALWLGGLVALGAIVAPVVFHVVPAPTSADAMTIVFRRFDTLAVGCACVVLVAEVIRALGRERVGRVDLVRASVAVLASALAMLEAFAISPSIEALHRSGAIRGFGDAGLRLEALHVQAERVASGEIAFGLALIGLHVWTLAHTRRPALERQVG
jgi:hypothetical protein